VPVRRARALLAASLVVAALAGSCSIPDIDLGCEATRQCGKGDLCTSGRCLACDRRHAYGLALGAAHTCALLDDGLACWGANDRGQLGVGAGAGATSPVPAEVDLGAPGFRGAVAAGAHHTCLARDQVAALRCWGDNTHGQLGADPVRTPGSDTPRYLPEENGKFALVTGAEHTCVANGVDELACFGDDRHGQLGRFDSPVPDYQGVFVVPDPVELAAPSSIDHILALAAGDAHTCALRQSDLESDNATLWCWGSNERLQIGLTDVADQHAARNVGEVKKPAVVAAGSRHTCVLAEGLVSCFGDNRHGQLGADPAVVGSVSARQHPDVGGFVASVTAGGDHTCALRGDTAYCWGDNRHGQLGIGADVPETFTPTQVLASPGAPLEHVAQLVAGAEHTCALTLEGDVLCWGRNDSGQVGDGSGKDRYYPEPVALCHAPAP
jgi:alpha-tubulin suppressor-like RCC1 family protein